MGNETQLTLQKAPSPGPEDIAVQSNARARLRDCISRLRPLDRQIILLYLEDIPQAEIGDIVGLSTANISTRINRAKTELKGMMSA
jgi:RNA polymerase sigma-70 factor (ECF subfamily)